MRTRKPDGRCALAAGLLIAVGGAPGNQAAAQSSPPPTEAVHAYTTPEERRALADLVVGRGLTLGGLVEVEGSLAREDGATAGDLALATLQLNLRAEISPLVRAEAVLLWEEGDTEPVDLDVAAIAIGGGSVPFALKAGRQYVPFGNFRTHLVSDPLTLALGETRESSAVLSYTRPGVELSVGCFNGDVDETGTDDNVGDAVAALTLAPHAWVSCGAYWISDIGESDGLQSLLLATPAPGAPGGAAPCPDPPAYEPVGGAGGFVSVQIAPVALEFEYLAALDDFAPGLLSGSAARPRAWNVEAAWTPLNVLEFAVRYEGSEGLPGWPDTRYAAGTTWAFVERASLAVEYLHGEAGDACGERDAATARLAVGF